MLDLAVTCFGILFCGVEIQAWSRKDVEAEKNLLACFVLGGDVVRSQFFKAIFSTPDQGIHKAGFGLFGIPFRCAKISEKAFAGQPSTFEIGERGFGAIQGRSCGNLGPRCDCGEEGGIFSKLLGGEVWSWNRFRDRKGTDEGGFGGIDGTIHRCIAGQCG